MLVENKILGFIIKPRFFFRFSRETIFSDNSLLASIKLILKLIFFSRIADATSKLLFLKNSSKMQDLAWIKYNSDGTKIHLYDIRNAKIGKYPKKLNRSQFENEIITRKAAGNISPLIHYSSVDDCLIIEDKIFLKSYSKSYLQALEILNTRLKISYSQSCKEYLSLYKTVKFSDLVLKLLVENDFKELIIKLCHGDFWKGNILEDNNGKIIIIDWEYCGPRIQTYDAWFLIYSQRHSYRNINGCNIYKCLQEVFLNYYQLDYDLKKVKIIHMTHLFERYANHWLIGKSVDSPEMLFLEQEVANIAKEIKYDTAN